MAITTPKLPQLFSPLGSSAKPRVLSLWMRSLDIMCCILALPALSVSAAVMAVITRVASPGPIFFRQERVGFQGRRFQIFKFRTMKVGADVGAHENHFKALMGSDTPMVKLDAKLDSRLIPGAWMLRASGLDELPQILNVLRGDMTLVGPRPSIPSEFELYAPAQRERVGTRPGLTGLWQVSGKNRTTFDEMIRLDLHYVRNASLVLNIKIILLTPWALLVQMVEVRKSRKSFALKARAPAAVVRLT
jgi:lipopolysaccharide/colanic/teichoic acid biosynthesis glycosyltransferase